MNLRIPFKNMLQEHPVFLLCLYGFFFHLRPADPFYTSYMTGPDKQFTMEEVTDKLSPIRTNSLLLLQLLVLLFTDLCQYKPVIMCQGLCQVISYSLLCFASSLRAMQYLQVTSAMVTACDIAIFSYAHNVVAADRYEKAFIYFRGCSLLGYAIGAVCGQLLVSLGHFSYYYLNIITLESASVAFIISIFLPMPSKEQPCSECTNDHIKHRHMNAVHSCCKMVTKFFKQQWMNFRECYSCSIVTWSSLWALVTAGYYQVIGSSQMLWDSLEHSDSVYVLNGGVEAAEAALGIFTFSVMDCMTTDWSFWGELALCVLCVVDSAAIFTMAYINNIWVGYAGHIVCKTIYKILTTIIMLNIAESVRKERFALVSGINNIASLLLLAIVNIVMTGIKQDIHSQFLIYASYFHILSGICGFIGVCTMINKRKKNIRDQQITDNSTGCP